jgi:hypothetical protein
MRVRVALAARVLMHDSVTLTLRYTPPGCRPDETPMS